MFVPCSGVTILGDLRPWALLDSRDIHPFGIATSSLAEVRGISDGRIEMRFLAGASSTIRTNKTQAARTGASLGRRLYLVVRKRWLPPGQSAGIRLRPVEEYTFGTLLKATRQNSW